jgi:hypothetical protein
MEDRTVAFVFAFVAGIFQVLTSIFMIISNLLSDLDSARFLAQVFTQRLSSAYGISVQAIGSIGLLFSFIILVGAILMLKTKRLMLGSKIVMVCSLLSLPFTLGGLGIGLLFGLIGALCAYASTKPDYSSD